MRNLQSPQIPNTFVIKDLNTKGYLDALNTELDNLRRDLNRFVSKMVVSSATGDKTLTADDEVVLCNGTFTLTMPPAGSSEGKIYYIKNIGTGIITITGDSTDTIDSDTSITLPIQYQSVKLLDDKTEWWII